MNIGLEPTSSNDEQELLPQSPEPTSADQSDANPSTQNAQGNHALQDYQMGLMLLEQQNRKRLLARDQGTDLGGHLTGQAASNSKAGPASENKAGIMESGDWLFSGAEHVNEEVDVVDMLLKRWTVQV
jgi:hypothetical protein